MFSNLEYLYEHLPSRFRRDDKDLFLKRYLQFFGETLDDYDDKFDSFFENINPATASEIWIEFWLRELFNWSWFPRWFTVEDKRRLYGNFAKHLARRGTANGIKLWLSDFSLLARVYTKPEFYGEMVWGDETFATSEPLLIAVEILHAVPRQWQEMSVYGEDGFGAAFYANNDPLFTNAQLVALLRFVQPDAQEILLIKKNQNFPHITILVDSATGEVLTDSATGEVLIDSRETI